MIISVSRRTDIPALYARWFMNRVRAGYCTVPNPINPRQVARVSLKPEDVDVFVFWTRNPRPMLTYLAELNARGYHYYFQHTLLNNPPELDPGSPSLELSLRTFEALSGIIGADRIIWRYDPIVISNITDVSFHIENYARICESLRGSSHRSVISILDFYKKTQKRLKRLKEDGINVLVNDDEQAILLDDLIPSIVYSARKNGFQITSCAETFDLVRFGVEPGKCVDDLYIQQVFGIEVNHKKDPSQREACGCVASKDIGMYNSCTFGCRYCYANSNFELSSNNFRAHDPEAPSLLGWIDYPET